MKVILHVKDGLAGNVLTTLLLAALSSFTIWWGLSHDRVLLFIAPLFCVPWLYVCYVLVQNIRNPKACTLAIDGDRLTWNLHAVEPGAVQESSIPLRSICRLEFVLPVIRHEGGVRDYQFAEMFIVDAHGNRQQLPTQLLPGVYREKIIAAIQKENPGVPVIERMDDAEEQQTRP